MQIRFLFPVLPSFTVAAACGMERIWRTRKKNILNSAICWGALAALVGSAAAVVAFTQASNANYPGVLQELLPSIHPSSVICRPVFEIRPAMKP
jgi:hypothetical protein